MDRITAIASIEYVREKCQILGEQESPHDFFGTICEALSMAIDASIATSAAPGIPVVAHPSFTGQQYSRVYTAFQKIPMKWAKNDCLA